MPCPHFGWQEETLVAKIEGFFKWAAEEARIVGETNTNTIQSPGLPVVHTIMPTDQYNRFNQYVCIDIRHYTVALRQPPVYAAPPSSRRHR